MWRSLRTGQSYQPLGNQEKTRFSDITDSLEGADTYFE